MSQHEKIATMYDQLAAADDDDVSSYREAQKVAYAVEAMRWRNGEVSDAQRDEAHKAELEDRRSVIAFREAMLVEARRQNAAWESIAESLKKLMEKK